MARRGVLVLNAGSSSLKFLLFADGGGPLEPEIRGQGEGLGTAPHFVARAPGGEVLAEKAWGEGSRLGHDDAVTHLAEFLRGEARGLELSAVGHRVVHGGPRFTRPVRIDREVL